MLSVLLLGCNDTQNYNTFFYKMYELQGHVKGFNKKTFQAEYQNGTYKKISEEPDEDKDKDEYDYMFNKDGYLTKAGPFIYTYNKDNSFKEGKIIGNEDKFKVILYINELGQAYGEDVLPLNQENETEGWKTKYFFNLDGALIREETIYWEGRDTREYQCNEQGLRIQYNVEYSFDYDSNTILNYEFEYLKFDKHGSWIERGIKITEIQQDVNIETGTVTNSTTSTEYSIEEREITYY